MTAASAASSRLGRLALAQVAQHQHAGEHHRHRVDFVLPGVLRRAAVDRLEDGVVGADVGSRRHAQAADQPGRRGRRECRRRDWAAPAHRTAPAFAPAACTCCRRCGPRTRCPGTPSATSCATCRKRPSVNFMMLALCTAVTLRRPLARAYSKANLTMRRLAATEMDLIADRRVGAELGAHRAGDESTSSSSRAAALELDAGVEVFGVLAHDDQVDVLVARAHAGEGLAGRRLA